MENSELRVFPRFAHEEEFALLALAVGGVNPLLMMAAYGLAVTAGLIRVTILGVKMYEKVKAKISRYEKYIPKISGVVLLTLAFGLTGVRSADRLSLIQTVTSGRNHSTINKACC